MEQYKYHQNEKTYGPFYEVQIIKMIENGKIQSDASLENVGTGNKFGIEEALSKISKSGVRKVMVTDFDMPFPSMFGFMVKWAIASIPAALLLAIFFGVISFFFVAVFG